MTHFCNKCGKFTNHTIKTDGKGHFVAASCNVCRKEAVK